MRRTTRGTSARWRNCILYELSLAGELSCPGWAMRLDKERLVAAVTAAMERRPVRGTSGGFAGAAVLTVCEGGLSVRCSDTATDIPASGMWASPIAADGFMLLRVLARISDEQVHLEYCEGRLGLNDRSVRAREI